MDFKEWEGKTIMNNVEGNSIGILFFHQFDWFEEEKDIASWRERVQITRSLIYLFIDLYVYSHSTDRRILNILKQTSTSIFAKALLVASCVVTIENKRLKIHHFHQFP